VEFELIAGLDPGFGVSTFRAFVGTVLETIGSWQDAGRYHPRLAVGAARPVDRQQLWIGFLHPGHGTKNSAIPKTCLSAPRPNRRIFGCENGDVSLGGTPQQAGRLCPDKG
jgi:hypothetical protein